MNCYIKGALSLFRTSCCIIENVTGMYILEPNWYPDNILGCPILSLSNMKHSQSAKDNRIYWELLSKK